MRPKEGIKDKRTPVSPASGSNLAYLPQKIDINLLIMIFSGRWAADDLAYLKNPIWWTGMVTSEHPTQPERFGSLDLRLIFFLCIIITVIVGEGVYAKTLG